MIRVQAQTTKKIQWISSGQTASPISGAVLNASEAVVSSLSLTSSGNGHYYGFLTMPTTVGIYVHETRATVATNLYIKRNRFKVVLNEVD